MLPISVTEWLDGNTPEPYAYAIASKQGSTLAHLKLLGIDATSDVGQFYLRYGSFSVRGWYELHEIESIAESTLWAIIHMGIPEGYLALTGIEGSGIVLYQKDTGFVFDVEFGQFEALQDGGLKPIANSFTGYLLWCKAKSEISL